MKNFALIGAAGYIAPRHLRAIKDTGNNLLAAYDPKDSVGILDSFFPEADFFTEFERFDRHLEKCKRRAQPIDFLTVCSPNYLHDAHIRFGLRLGADVICEKPLVLNPWNADALEEAETETGHRVFTILQLRLHPQLLALKKELDNAPAAPKREVELTYITSRGKWYHASWKGEPSKSGGVATNIGIHFFDLLIWLFGKVERSVVHRHTHDRAAGFLELERARVRWFLSIEESTLPEAVRQSGKRTFRSLTLDNQVIEFSDGFTDLHTESYRQIFSGKGFGIREARPSIQLAYEIRNAAVVGLEGDFHPLAALEQKRHPFT